MKDLKTTISMENYYLALLRKIKTAVSLLTRPTAHDSYKQGMRSCLVCLSLSLPLSLLPFAFH